MQQTPDALFFYSLCIVLISALIAIIWRYTSKIDKTMEIAIGAISELKTMTSLHEQRLDTHEEHIGELKNHVFKVTYKK